MTFKLETIRLSTENPAKLVRVSANVHIAKLIDALKLSPTRALLILNGGTTNLDNIIGKQLSTLFYELARILIKENITVITGGTKAGIFSLFGKALHRRGGPTAPCIGITITGRTTLDKLEPNHTHFVLVDGNSWGEETDIMYKIAHELAKNAPSLAIFAGGGEVFISEMQKNTDQNREMILIAGSKGSTDKLIEAHLRRNITDARFDSIIRKGGLTEFNIDNPLA